MKIFCDTNIVMEFLQERKFVAEVRRILLYALKNGDILSISCGSFYTITYLSEIYLKSDKTLDKGLRTQKLRYILNGVLSTFMLVSPNPATMIEAVNDLLFDDLEDSYQAHVAEQIGCEVFLTINKKHFANHSAVTSMKILSPDEFVEMYL